MRGRRLLLVLASLCIPAAALATEGGPDCSGSMVPQPLPLRTATLAPVAHELQGAAAHAGTPRGILAHGASEELAVDRVLVRHRLEGCQVAVVDPGAGYQRKTEFDNTPYRFNAENGFTAAEFDAWMQERGIRIVNGRAVVGGSAETDAVMQPVSTTVASCERDADEQTLSC